VHETRVSSAISGLLAGLVGQSDGIAVWVGDRCDTLPPRHVGRVFQHPDRLRAQLGYQLVHVIDLHVHLKPRPVAQIKTVLLL
jgi:hypothetical protein